MDRRALALALLVPLALAACTETGDSPFMSLDGGEDAAVSADVPEDAPADLPGDPGGDVPTVQVTWEGDVRPLFEQKGCLAGFCHGTAASGGLNMESVEGLETGGAHGPAVVPCEPGSGTLLDKLSDDPSFGQRMPVSGLFLSEDEQALVEAWIAQGARVTADDPGCEGR